MLERRGPRLQEDSDQENQGVHPPPKTKTKTAKECGVKSQMPPANESCVEGDGVQDDGGDRDTPEANCSMGANDGGG